MQATQRQVRAIGSTFSHTWMAGDPVLGPHEQAMEGTSREGGQQESHVVDRLWQRRRDAAAVFSSFAAGRRSRPIHRNYQRCDSAAINNLDTVILCVITTPKYDAVGDSGEERFICTG